MQSVTTQTPLVSVVIASYNMGQYISQAVDSILKQSWPSIEVIVIDDGSQDNTPAVMNGYASDSRVQYIRNENQGQPKAKNFGIRQTRGDFIAFCDADDFWEPNKLEVQMPFFANPSVGIVYSEVSNIDEHNKRYQKPPAYTRHTGKVTNHLLTCNFVPFGTAVIRRACIEKNGIFDEQFRMGIDWDLWCLHTGTHLCLPGMVGTNVEQLSWSLRSRY
jgi:glycosyltransferase involved in cell wall biosynthesis